MKVTGSSRSYAEGLLARVDRERERDVGAAEVERILAGLSSPDEHVRVRALRDVCPCRMPWPVFEQLRKPALKLRNDPSPAVRAAAFHVEEDARGVAFAEALVDRVAELEDARYPSATDKLRRRL